MLSIARITISILIVSLLAVVFTASSPSVCAQYDCNNIIRVEVPEVPQELMCGVVSQCGLRLRAYECQDNDPEAVAVYSIGPFGFPTTPKVDLGPDMCSENLWWKYDTCADPTWSAGEEVYFISDYGETSPDELVTAIIDWRHCDVE